LAGTFPSVKPQAWFDSPAVFLPTDEIPRLSRPAIENPDGRVKRQDDNGQEANPDPIVTGTGSYITSEGIKSTYEVTQEMLDEANLETLEHVTARVWIDHQRRGDVEVELLSPSGQLSVLARQRRFDEATTGFAGWKFMSVKHWYVFRCRAVLTIREENPVGTWTITVKDAANPDKIGRFVAWSLQLWGESIDPALTHPWAPAEEGQPDEEQTGSDPTTVINQKPKPTNHLPDDHASAPGESHLPGLAMTTAADAVDPTATSGQSDELGEPGFLGGVTDLASSSSWLAGAGGIIMLAGIAVGVFFLLRRRRRSRNLFGLANNGEGGARGDYAPVSEDVPMGLLERGRRKLGGGKAPGAAGSKELYDAFGDGPSDESDDDDRLNQSTALKYHDDFLEDEGDERRSPVPRQGGFEDDDQPERQGGESSTRLEARGSRSGSSGSWQDAADEVR
jgi:kexin